MCMGFHIYYNCFYNTVYYDRFILIVFVFDIKDTAHSGCIDRL